MIFNPAQIDKSLWEPPATIGHFASIHGRDLHYRHSWTDGKRFGRCLDKPMKDLDQGENRNMKR